MLKLHDTVIVAGLWLWLTLAVGPWWVGVMLLLVAWFANIYRDIRKT